MTTVTDRNTVPECEHIDQWIESTKVTHREHVAIDAPDATLTYEQLFTRADELSDVLRGSGVRPGSLVALCCPRSAAYIVSALAVLRCGAAYVPLDPESPTERLRFIIDDCRTRLLIADEPSAARLTGGSVQIITISAGHGEGSSHTWLPDAGETAAHGFPADEIAPGLAYVIYTSGSTGRPKGVMVEHESVVGLARWHIRAFGLSSSDRVSQVAGPAFDAAVWEIWPALAAGACVVIPDELTRRDPRSLQRFLVQERMNVSFVPTAIAERMIDLPWPADSVLRYLLTGGDALHAVPPAGLPFVLVNNYGLTEATVVSTSGVVEPDEVAGSPSIGRAIDGTELDVVDELLRPVEDGVVGELIVSGASVARGYLHRPELDRARFIADDTRPGRRRLRTGDRVRRNPGGSIEFRGRVDDQVKVRGYRIELGEVAAALNRHPSIASSHVLLGGESAQTHRLDAYVVAAVVDSADRGLRPEAADLVAFLRTSLPAYMVPQTFAWVDELPLSVNGKVDSAGLARGTSVLLAEVAVEEPWQAELMSAVSILIVDLLGATSVAPDDDFFLLGGHSLLGAQLVGRVREKFGVDLRLRDVFECPTVAGLASRIGELVIAEIALLDDDEAVALANRDGASSALATRGHEPSALASGQA